MKGRREREKQQKQKQKMEEERKGGWREEWKNGKGLPYKREEGFSHSPK